MADQMVMRVQEWLNTTYGSVAGWENVVEDGYTGNGTVAGLIRALQIELNTTPDGILGNGTVNLFNNRFTNGLSIQIGNNSENTNIIYILQGGFFCRGIHPGEFSGVFVNSTEEAVKQLQQQIGLSNQDGIVTGKLMRAILTTDAFTLINNGDENIRTIQQSLNQKYGSNLTKYVPTNGLYDRQTNIALISAIQIENNLAVDGLWGDDTYNSCPLLTVGSSNRNMIYILQYLLYCNGFDPNGFDGGYGNGVKNAVKSFQSFCALDSDGICGKQTWASLAVSYGDKNRSTYVCDTRFEITHDRAQILKNNGYTTVGRYLTGGDFKELRDNELELILSEGLKMFPIFQENGRSSSDFNSDKGRENARSAITAAKAKGIPKNTIIYFAVDYDALDYEVTDYIIPYFYGIKEVFQSNINTLNYRIGVYGARNVCSRVSNSGYAISSFISDMSSGFSGNLGYTLPTNWNYDQINNIVLTDPVYGSLEIDKVVCSEKFNSVNSKNSNAEVYKKLKEIYDYALQRKDSIIEANNSVLDFLRGSTYRGVVGWDELCGTPDYTFINEIEQKFPEYTSQSFEVDCGNITIKLDHLAVVAQAYLSLFGNIEEFREYGGWAGDLAQLGAVLQQKYGNNQVGLDYEDIALLVGCTEIDALRYGFSNAGDTKFPLMDLYQDLDGAVIGKRIHNESLLEVFDDYYLGEKYNRRANLFYDALNKDGYEGNTKYDTLLNLARIYSYNPYAISEAFGMLFGSFEEEVWGECLAQGFATKVSSMINMENS